MCRFACMGMHACVATLQGLASVLCLCSTTRQTASICLSLLYFSCLKKYLSFSLCRPCCSRSRAFLSFPFFSSPLVPTRLCFNPFKTCLLHCSRITSLIKLTQNIIMPELSYVILFRLAQVLKMPATVTTNVAYSEINFCFSFQPTTPVCKILLSCFSASR